MSEIFCMPLKQLTDGPLFGSGPGTLSELTNMELRPRCAEARGGFEELKPSGGTAANAISAGGYADAIQMSTSYGWIRRYDSAAGAGSQYSANWQFHPGYFAPFSTGVVNDAIYWGADLPFSRVGVEVLIAAVWTVTIVYEYWDGSSWSALTTAETIDWAVAAGPKLEYASWTAPTDWAATTVGDSGTGNILKYWMRARISVSTVVTTTPKLDNAFGFWTGMREIYVANHDPRTAAAGALLRRHGQTGTTEEWFSVGSSLFSGSSSPARLAAYRGRVFMVNGKEQKKWDGFSLTNIGLDAPGSGTMAAPSGAAPGLGTGVWRVYVAFGYGPCKRQGDLAHPYNWEPLYGWSEATYVGEVSTAAAGNEYITIDWSGLTIGSNVSALAIYLTDDLTNVDAGQKQNMPAFLWDTQNAAEFTIGTTYILGVVSTEKLFPPLEATRSDNKPKAGCKFISVYQNRLFLGDDEYWYWSEPFQPDVFNNLFNYVALAKATGGRHMGGIEFGDQMVLFTETQTWGLTNVDLDIPQLFPIALGIGCIAPDAIAVVDGVLIWPAQDGFYAWRGGSEEPFKISGKMKETFGDMSYENHGGSKATGHRGRYDVRLSSPDYSTVGNAYRFSIESAEWCQISPTGFASTLFPLTTVYAPLGNNDAGGVHPLWGKVDYGTGAGEYGLFLGELTTQDDGTNYICSATMHFPLRPGDLFTPWRVKAYYQAADGWATPSFSLATTDFIGTTAGTLNTGTPDTGDDYSIIGGTFSQVGRGASDIQVQFTVSSAAGGTVNQQRLFGGILQGKVSDVRRGGI